MSDESIATEFERVRGETTKALLEHQIECTKRYGEITGRLDKQEALLGRNTKLLYVILGGMLMVVAKNFWSIFTGSL